MKPKSILLFVMIAMVLCSITSCSDENQLDILGPDYIIGDNVEICHEIGRFDNAPFTWDYSFSTDSVNDDEGLAIYPVETSEDTICGSRDITVDQMLIIDPNIVYVGAAFPASSYANDYSKEIVYPRNPIDVYTSFPDPYIGEITKETGAIGYKKFMKEVIRSSEYKSFIEGGGREGLDFQCTEVFSYSDIEKALSSNAGFAKIFSAKVQNSSKKTNIKSRLFAQLTSKNFTVTMDVPPQGFFKDKTHDTAPEDPVYIRSLSYGKVAVLAIESEYSFEEVKKAIEAGVKFNLFSGDTNFSAKDKEILQKATLTICVISDESNVTQYFDSFDKIKDIFKISYSENHYGLPIFCKGYYTKDNSIFSITINTNSSGRPPVGGGSSSVTGPGRH